MKTYRRYEFGIHHNLECNSAVAARLEAVETQLQSLLQGSLPPPGLQPTDNSDSRPNGPAVQFELATPVQETETHPTVTEDAMQQAANDAWYILVYETKN